MWYMTSSGKIELKITREQAHIGSHQGKCDEAIAYLRTVPAIRRQLDKLNPQTVSDELAEHGAWDDEQLADHDENLSRLLWVACGDIVDNLP